VSKGEATQQMIVARAAQLFNRQGYFGSSIEDLMNETGLKKGGIYNHFRSKDELALAAFDYAVEVIWQCVEEEMKDRPNQVDRLQGMLAAYQRIIEDPPIKGGCPVLNTAIESDDTHPALRERARGALTRWRTWIQRRVTRGIEAGEVRPEVDSDLLATLLISMIEGAIMMSKAYDDPVHIRRAVQYLSDYLEREVRAR
jgi:TetR/AcrR family transcriptional repressor of nem operon